MDGWMKWSGVGGRDGVICYTMKLLDSKIVEDILLENYFVRDVKGLNKKI